jgi:predicted phosphodiesterase
MSGPSVPFAIISDIHANLEALQAVLDDIEESGVERIICLGDIVGYGPDFETCIDIIAERCEVVLRGNHDEAVIEGPVDFNPVARDVINYTREILKPGLIAPSRKRIRWNFLRDLRKTYEEPPLSFYHGSPRDPVREYVMKTDVVFAPEKLVEIFSMIEGACFIGHTHQPGVIVEGFLFIEPGRIGNIYRISDGKAVINIGSVGQPRDGDNRASYVIVKDDAVHFRRVAYDFRKIMAKIEANPRIHRNCATRLQFGK